MVLEAVLGQEKLMKNFIRALEQNQLAHAYLIEGQHGLGKRNVARQMAKGICCRAIQGKPCDECISCKKLDHDSHPEVIWVQEETSIKIEAVRDLQKNIQMKPYEGSKKVYIICDAEKMTLQAQNALLKTLEEPPEYVTIILLTTNSNSLLTTIISRCQRLKLLPVALETIEKYLIEKKAVAKEEARVLASLSRGIPGRAIQLLEDEAFQQRRQKVIKLTRHLVDKKTFYLLENLQDFYEEKQFIEESLELMMGWYRDVLLYKHTNKADIIINIDEIEEIIYQSDILSLENIKEMIFIIEETKNNFRSNVNLQLNLETMLLQLKKRVNESIL
ncbi:DNA polymerase III subunit delta' [Clostridium formicaceticum]|uniref:DNA polymerase III subunit delta' n=1 Tax=Clostridium formicaceticum TaxID=1497 RepID=A0AAC9RHA1_9CLOT|nr:DNA polymerase III subunit delta' [Clostridium formicaceticum]AOY75475.1 DNA polymerase III subunit delta' [Clostridium formicaceticum]ARE85762.1 DNA polymerase III subunit tau [Clostridium formicaceticum]